MQAYGMEIKVKKTEVMIINETAKPMGNATVYNVEQGAFEQVTHFKYLGSWITEDARSDEDIRARVGMAKAAFWQNKELLRSNIKLSTKIKILNCYVFSVLDYGCESWTWV